MTEVVISQLADETLAAARPATLIDLVFAGDTNHHGALFGGVALAGAVRLTRTAVLSD